MTRSVLRMNYESNSEHCKLNLEACPSSNKTFKRVVTRTYHDHNTA